MGQPGPWELKSIHNNPNFPLYSLIARMISILKVEMLSKECRQSSKEYNLENLKEKV